MTRQLVVKTIVFLLCLVPFAGLVVAALTNQLGANPIERVTHETGQWALRFLLLTLSVTPLRRVLKFPKLIVLRRMLGLYAFFYASLHFLTYLVLDQYFAWRFIWEDISERPYILLGFAAFILLIPLAVTSTNAMMRYLAWRWKKLHRMVYLIAILAVIHFFMLTKADYLEPIIYGGVLAALLVFRFYKVKN